MRQKGRENIFTDEEIRRQRFKQNELLKEYRKTYFWESERKSGEISFINGIIHKPKGQLNWVERIKRGMYFKPIPYAVKRPNYYEVEDYDCYDYKQKLGELGI